jgi:hypothetical protein
MFALSYARPQNMKIEITVMPAWMAGIQACKDASGNLHVNLDSSAPCWNDANEGFCLIDPSLSAPYFQKEVAKNPPQNQKVRGIDP